MSNTVLELRGITKIFPGVKALDKVQFDLHEGDSCFNGRKWCWKVYVH